MTTQIRHRGTQSDGNAFSEKQKNAVWEKAQRAMEHHPFLTAACQFFSKEFKFDVTNKNVIKAALRNQYSKHKIESKI